ncbi:MAG: glycosyltransferase [Patescibacteria group bacterium]
MKKLEKITILIPCHNEEKGLGRVIDDVPRRMLKKLGFSVEVIVINNSSTDRTALIAQKRKATVITDRQIGIAIYSHISKLYRTSIPIQDRKLRVEYNGII